MKCPCPEVETESHRHDQRTGQDLARFGPFAEHAFDQFVGHCRISNRQHIQFADE